MSKTLYVSCRRDDGAGTVGRLRYRLVEHFGGDTIHFETRQRPASPHHLRHARADAAGARLVLALVGRGWSGAADEHGRRRLDDPNDIVRAPVATALGSAVTVIVVLLDTAVLPTAGELPDDLRALRDCRVATVRHETFADDVRRLVGMVERVLLQGSEPAPATSVPTTISARGLVRGREPMSRRRAFIASRVAGPIKRRRVRRAVIENARLRTRETAPFDFFEWFRIYGPLTIYVVMVAFFAYLAAGP